MGILDVSPSIQRTLLEEAIEWLRPQSAEARVAWVLAHMPDTHVVSSSFGVQSAVMLHLMTRARPDIPVLLMDTGYLFPETYSYIDALSERLSLNLHIYRADLSPAWQESRFGQLWEQGEEGLKKYNTLNKVEPMERALGELGARTWFAGLRRSQSDTRADLPLMEVKDGRVKTYPLADWSNRQVHAYLKAHDLPQHPLWEEGYVSVGDTHSTAKFAAGMREQDTRFPGHSRECGLHG